MKAIFYSVPKCLLCANQVDEDTVSLEFISKYVGTQNNYFFNIDPSSKSLMIEFYALQHIQLEMRKHPKIGLRLDFA